MPFQRGGGGLPDLSPPSPLPLILLEGMSHDKFLKALWRVLQLLIFPFFFFCSEESAKQLKGITDSQWINICTREVKVEFAVYTPFLRAIRWGGFNYWLWLLRISEESYMNCGAASLGCITRQLCCINWVDNVNWLPRKDGLANISSRVSASSR